MSTSSHRASMAPPPNANLYCAQCDSQIGIFENEWVQLTPTYARSKEKGTHFGTEIGTRTQVVPSAEAKGCEMSEIFCKKCSIVVGQHCKTAPAGDPDKRDLVGQNFYKLTRTYLKDAQTSVRMERIMDNSRKPMGRTSTGSSRENIASAPRLSSLTRLSGTPVRASMPPVSRARLSQTFTPNQSTHMSPPELPYPTSAGGSLEYSQELVEHGNLIAESNNRLSILENQMARQRRCISDHEERFNHIEDRTLGNYAQAESLQSLDTNSIGQLAEHNNIIVTQQRRISEQEEQLRLTNTRLETLQNSMSDMKTMLMALTPSSTAFNSLSVDSPPFINIFESMLRTMKDAHRSAQDLQQLRDENAKMKIQLEKANSTSNTLLTEEPSLDASFAGSDSAVQDSHVLGKRKRLTNLKLRSPSQMKSLSAQQPNNVNAVRSATQQVPTPGSSQASEASPIDVSYSGRNRFQKPSTYNAEMASSRLQPSSTNDHTQTNEFVITETGIADIIMGDDDSGDGHVDAATAVSAPSRQEYSMNSSSLSHSGPTGANAVIGSHMDTSFAPTSNSQTGDKRTSARNGSSNNDFVTNPNGQLGPRDSILDGLQKSHSQYNDFARPHMNGTNMPPFFGATLLPPSMNAQYAHQSSSEWPLASEISRQPNNDTAHSLSTSANKIPTTAMESPAVESEANNSMVATQDNQLDRSGDERAIEFSDEETPNTDPLPYPEDGIQPFDRPTTRAHDPLRRLTDSAVNREDRSMAPEPPKRQRLAETKRQGVGVNMNRCIISTPEMFDGLTSRNPKSVRPPSIQSRERDLNDELVRLGLEDWIGKDKNSKEYKDAVDKARTRQRIMNKATQMLNRGLPGELPPEIAEAVRNLNATKPQPIDVSRQYPEPYLHGVMKLTDLSALNGNKKKRAKKDRKSNVQPGTNTSAAVGAIVEQPTSNEVQPQQAVPQEAVEEVPPTELQNPPASAEVQSFNETITANTDATSKEPETSKENLQPLARNGEERSRRRSSKRGRPSAGSDLARAADGGNDDNCAVCSKRGNVLCCDGCPKVYHHKCLTPPMDPKQDVQGDWFCPACQQTRSADGVISESQQTPSTAKHTATTLEQREQEIRERDRLVQEAMEREETIVVTRY